MSYFAWQPALPGTRLPQQAGWPRRRTRGQWGRARPGRPVCLAGTQGNRAEIGLCFISPGCLGLDCPSQQAGHVVGPGPGRPGTPQREQAGRSTWSVAAAAGQGNHHRDETEMAFPGRTRLRSPPLEPAGERARPAATPSKGHRAEMELWRNKKALDLRGHHRTTPHRSGERRGYRSETESPCDQVNQPPATVRERLALRPKREFSPSGEMCPSLADKSASRKA